MVATPAFAQSTEGTARKSVRLIAPELIAPAPSAGRLERLPALAPMQKPGIAPKAVIRPARFRLLPLPIAESAGVLLADGYRIALAGIGPSDVGENCGVSGWPCGATALTAFRAYLRGRSLRCRVPDERPPGKEIVVAECTLAGADIGAWLVRHGWARSSGGVYAEEEKLARERRLGLFGPPPPIYAPSFPSINAQVSGTP